MEEFDAEIDLDEGTDTGFVSAEDGPASLTYTARDSEDRCIETFHLDLGGDYEDVIASAQDFIEFLRKFGSKHNFEMSE